MRSTASSLPFLILLAACSNDPVYIPSPMAIEAGQADGNGGTVALVQTSLQLPIMTETMLDAQARMNRSAELMLEVPYVKVGDIEVSVEWKVDNLTDEDGQVEIQLNGANEYWAYDPVMAAVGLDEDEPQPPGLDGDVPLHIPAYGTLTGVFREDQLREASIDLDQITRGNINPFRATLTISKNATQFSELAPLTYDANGEPLPQEATGVVYPREAFAQIVRVDLVFKPDRHMRLEYTVRVRDVRGIMHELLDAAVTEAPDELTVFMPMTYVPPAAP
jgi:hypothetical protein